jgi:hypothetical protein
MRKGEERACIEEGGSVQHNVSRLQADPAEQGNLRFF